MESEATVRIGFNEGTASYFLYDYVTLIDAATGKTHRVAWRPMPKGFNPIADGCLYIGGLEAMPKELKPIEGWPPEPGIGEIGNMLKKWFKKNMGTVK